MKRFVCGLVAAAGLLPAVALADYKTYNKTLVYNQDVWLKKYHDITIRARCLRLDSWDPASDAEYDPVGYDVLYVYATADNPAILRGHDNYLGNGSYLTHSTPPQYSRLAQVMAPTGEERFDNGINGGWAIGLFDRRGLSLDADKSALAVNPFGHEGCYISLMLDKITEPGRAKGGYLPPGAR